MVVTKILTTKQNTAGKLPENSRKSFIDLQSQKDGETDQKILYEMLRCYIKNLLNLLLLLIAALK